MIGASGPVTLNGTAFGGQAEVEATLTPQPSVRDGRNWLEDVVDVVYLLSGRVRWASQTAAQAEAIQAEAVREFDCELRSVDAGDPVWVTPLEVTVEGVSDLQLTEAGTRRDHATGAVAYDLELEVQALAPLTRSDLGLDVGAFELVGEGTEPLGDYYDVQEVDGATFTDDSETLTIEDENGDPLEITIDFAIPGDPRTVAARVDDVSDPDFYLVQTREPAP